MELVVALGTAFSGHFERGLAKKEYKGEAKNYKGDAKTTSKMEYKQHKGFSLYMAISGLLFASVVLACIKEELKGSRFEFLLPLATSLADHPYMLAFAMSVGPIILGGVLMKLTGDKGSLLWPFHKEPLHIFGLHVLMGAVIVVAPCYHVITNLLAPKSFYCEMWGC